MYSARHRNSLEEPNDVNTCTVAHNYNLSVTGVIETKWAFCKNK